MKIATCLSVMPLLLSACAAAAGPAPAPAAPKAEVKAVAAAPKHNVKLQLPPAIYAVPGIESNLYFENVVCVINPDNYVFDVKCVKGRNDQKRWRYTPKAGEKGTFDLELTVISDNGIEAVGKTQLIVTPAETAKGKEFAILVIGDSLTAASIYPKGKFCAYCVPS